VQDMEAQDRVVQLVDGINLVLAGADTAEAETALSLAVVAAICTVAPNDAAARLQMAEGFTQQVRNLVRRDDIVEWIAAATIQVQRTRQQ
jgi:hypothetical protein